MKRRSTDWVLLGTAILAFLFVAFRAHVQSITIDEALSYSNFVGPESGPLRTAASNNHILNSLLMWIFTSLFGVSHLTVRAGALTGAALYISAAYLLCRWIADGLAVRWALFVCLVGNPFILDFLVAARGYGLASGLLLWAIVAIASAQRKTVTESASPKAMVIGCAQASVLVALSFTANFSFAFVDAALMVMVLVWACMTLRGPGASFTDYIKIAAACVLPGLLLAGLVDGPVVIKFSKAELVYGAPSLRILLRSLYEATTYEVNPHLPIVLRGSRRWMAFLFRAIGILSLIQLGVLLFRRGGHSQSRWLRGFVGLVLGTVAISLGASWAAFHFVGVLWPEDRTGIYFAVLSTLFVGSMAAVSGEQKKWLTALPRTGLAIAMFGLTIYFALCLRVSYFKEWNWGADTDKIYTTLASYNRSCGLKSVATNWRYDAALNFYRSAMHGTFDKFVGSMNAENYPDGKQGYVLSLPDDQSFLAKHNLKIVYQSELGSTIAIDPAACPNAATIPFGP